MLRFEVPQPVSIYERLHVRRIINGAGSQTRLSGTIMREEAVSAMVEASRSLVDIEHLQARASEAISEVTGAEAGLVTSGAAAALMLGTAACVAELDIAKMERLPDTTGMKNEVVMARHHRNAYDHMIRLAGVRIVEAGLDELALGAGVRGVEGWEIEAAISERTAAIAYVQKPGGRPSLDEVTKIAKSHGVPVLVDAAAELPPVANLRHLIERGATLVAFSGGKTIRGPQATGILCGRRDLVMSAAVQMIDMDSRFETWDPPKEFIDKSKLKGIPRHGVGRGFKVGKEEIVGLMTALKLYAEENEEERTRQLEKRAKHLVEILSGAAKIRADYLPSSTTRPVPIVQLTFLDVHDVHGMIDLVDRLRSEDPPIYLVESMLEEMVLLVNPFNLRDEDVEILASRLKAV